MKKRLPIFATTDGRAKYIAAYEAMFSLWTVPHESIEVKTRYGSTFINATGPGDGHPLVLLHAAGLSSTAWFANIAELSHNFRVYAVDVIGDAGKSVADHLMEERVDYAEWLREVFDGLNIDRGYLAGHSYGGWLTLNMALAYPDRLSKLVLLAPAASIYPFCFLAKLTLRLTALNLRPSARFTLKMQASKGTVFEEAFVFLMEMVSRYCVPATMFPTVDTEKELKQIDVPTLLLIGAGEKIYNPKVAIERAERLMPNLTAEIVPNAGHTLIMEQPEIINARILDFLDSN
jgi:pimeloyl-ACP methyl ester carboxylesterase